MLQINPWLFRVDYLEDDQCEYDENGAFTYPDSLSLNYDSLDHIGVYLMNDGFDIYMWVGAEVDPAVLQSLFGVTNIDDLFEKWPEEKMFGGEDDLCNKLQNMLAEMRSKKTTKYQNLIVVPTGKNSPSEITFYYKLYEEKHTGYVGGYAQSYAEFYNNFVNTSFSSRAVTNPSAIKK